MRVAYILGKFPSLSETFILREIQALTPLGIDVSVFALERGSRGKTHAAATELAERACYPSATGCGTGSLTCRPTRFLRALRIIPELARLPGVGLQPAIRRFGAACAFAGSAQAKHIDRVHAHFAFATADAGRFLATLLGVPYSVSAHAWDIHVQPAESLSARLSPATFICVCSAHGRDAILTKCPDIPSERVHLIRHGLFVDRWPPDTLTRTPCKVWEQGDACILGVGRLEPKKGFTHLIEACRLLHRRGTVFGCAIAGDGIERENLARQIADADLGSRVELTGPLTQRECRDLIGHASVFVLPAITTPDGDRDGVPNVLLEACACGVPVVATPTGGIPELIEHEHTGLLTPPGDSKALADVLASLLGDLAQRRRLGAAGRKRVEREYDVTRNVMVLAELLRTSQPTAGTARK